ncbi:MAG: hypothetical protein JNM78_09410 [Cyclobacteriaceae bacterium]|nr:hypothetical protein [Cyclobacteriaceae bacterium]
MQTGTYKTIAEYIALFPKDIQAILKEVKLTIAKAAIGGVETINYAIPTIKLNGKNLVHFAAYKSHIGFYPGSKAVEVFATQLTKYKTAKGSIQFPIERKLPFSLITKIVKYRVEAENKKLSMPKLKKAKLSNKK